MTSKINAKLEFVVWANNNLNHFSILKTLEVLQNFDKVDLGKLFVAFEKKLECPRDLQHLINDNSFNPVMTRPTGTICCANCASLNMLPSYHVPWVPLNELIYFNSSQCKNPYVCEHCYEILYVPKPPTQATVKFSTEDI